VVTKPALQLAIGQEQSGIAVDDLIGRQPEPVRREGGMTADPKENPTPPVGSTFWRSGVHSDWIDGRYTGRVDPGRDGTDLALQL
jgi:hypothetical protein